MQSSVLYYEKAYNYLNIKEKILDIYFQIALMVNQRSLWTEFATMSLLLLPQSKGVFLQLACDLVIYGCSPPYVCPLHEPLRFTSWVKLSLCDPVQLFLLV